MALGSKEHCSDNDVAMAMQSENLVLSCTSPNLFHQSHSLKQCLHSATESETVSRSVVSSCLQPHGLKPNRLLCPWNFPGQNTGVRSHSLLQEIFPTRNQTWSPTLNTDSLPSEPQRSPIFLFLHMDRNGWNSFCGFYILRPST